MENHPATAFVPSVAAVLPPIFEELRSLAGNYWWSWQTDGAALFRDLDPTRWEASGHNPRRLLSEVPLWRLAELDTDPRFRTRARDLLSRFAEAMSTAAPWAESLHPHLTAERPVAYFSAEFAIHESLPIYAGGLGVLAGDHLKSASDLGLPLVGIGLLYRQGCFLQHLDHSAWQHERYIDLAVGELPLERVTDPDRKPLSVNIAIQNRTVRISIWLVRVGRVRLYLLDTNREDNEERDRWITGHLYGGDNDTRIVQELTLGIGGVRTLRALGIDPAVYHMNEGHSAFLALELLREKIATGVSLEEAREQVRNLCVFTTHTPVTAGHDVFSVELMDTYLASYWAELGLTRETILSFGRRRQDDASESFGMTPLAIRFARSVNGVSRRHGAVCRTILNDLWPEHRQETVPIDHVTNGIHVPTWTAPLARALYDHHLGRDWEERLDDPELAARIDAIPDEELWELRNQLRRHLVAAVRAHCSSLGCSNGENRALAATAEALLDPNVLTIGFARRMASYKRLSLLAQDQERTIALLTNPERPVQLVISGKAHPCDDEAKRTLQKVLRLKSAVEHCGRIAYLENYDAALARRLVHGCDVWLNLPRRPLEASGTSGQKVVANGVLNVSVLDGWWVEGHCNGNGWVVGDEFVDLNPDKQDKVDIEALYRILESEVVPLFYERDQRGIPRGWLVRVRSSIKTLLPFFNTHRMVREYAERIYTGGKAS